VNLWQNINNMKKIFTILIGLFAICGLKAQAPKKFYTRFGGNGYDVGYGVKQTLDGQYIVTGSTSSFGQGNTDVYLVKVDSMGWVLWEKAFGGFNNDIGKQVIQLADSGYVVTGYTNSFGNGGYDVYLLRTDKNGVLLWQKTFGGMDWDFAYDLKQTTDNGYLICGSTASFGYGKNDGYIIKTDANGILQWSKTYGGTEDDEFKSIALTYNNLYAFGGTTSSYGDVNGDCWLFKTDLMGDSVLHVKYGTPNKQFINKIIEVSNHDFMLCGGNDVGGNDSTWSYFLCMFETGVFKYESSFSKHTLKDQQFQTLLNSKNIEFIYVEKEYNSPVGFKLEPSICIFAGQFYQYCNTYGSLDDEILYDIAKTKDKGFVTIGYTTGFNANLSDVFFVKMDSTILGSSSIVGLNEVVQKPNRTLVFPTITSSFVNVQLNNELKNPDLKIYNNIGDIIYQAEMKNQNQKIDLTSFSNGFYYISISENSSIKTFKIIKTD
jgi:hypothetical protein